MEMDKEAKKNIRLVSSNKDARGNRVDATEEERNAYSPLGQHAKELMARAAELHKPLNGDYLGSAVVHFYKQDILANRQNLLVVCQTSIDKVTDEQHASLGWKQLGEVMMRKFGRKPPKNT